MEDKRMISRERGETIAREHGIRFLETSAKANINIDRAFLELAEAILNKVVVLKSVPTLSSQLLCFLVDSKLPDRTRRRALIE